MGPVPSTRLVSKLVFGLLVVTAWCRDAGQARAEGEVSRRFVVALEAGAGQGTFDKDPGRGLYAYGLDATWNPNRLALGLTLERASQIGDDPRALSFGQILAHAGYAAWKSERWTVTPRVFLGGGRVTRDADDLNPAHSNTGVAAGPSVTLDWHPGKWFAAGLEGRVTWQLYMAENPFTSRSALLLLRGAATF